MSAYKTIECSIVCKDTLVQALKDLGLAYEDHAEPVNLYGFGGDQRNQKADIVVRRSHLNTTFTGASNDLGFAWNADSKQYKMICSDYDEGCGVASRVKQAYAAVAIVKALGDSRLKVQNISGDIKARKRTKVTISASKVI